MALPEVPLLRNSTVYCSRLVSTAKDFGETAATFHRRVNWSYRYAAAFYQSESDRFRAGPEAYLAGRIDPPQRLEDVFALRLSRKQVANAVLKTGAHWLFYLLGRLANRRIRKARPAIWRKGYVDDIEMVYDPDETGVVRAIFPFPLSLSRQWRYLRHLREKGFLFKLDGNPYAPGDLLRLLWRRDMRSLQRLESRAQVRHAYEVAALGVKTVQVSDEFDIGSLDFCRALARFPVHVVNSAHGSGKYLPIHAYREFHVITRRQEEYYHAVRPCRYVLRPLNDKAGAAPVPAPQPSSEEVRLVFLSQVFSGISEIIPENERSVVQRLAAEFSGSSRVRLLYRPHPNCRQVTVPSGFERLWRLEDVNGRPGTVFASFFSTCQIDPTFKGRKILLRSGLIHPEIAFDDDEETLGMDELVDLLKFPDKLGEALLEPGWKKK